MEKSESAEMGMNKTGMATASKLGKEMVQSSKEIPVSRDGGVTPDEMRLDYINDGAKIGSVPPPTSIKGMAKSAMTALRGEKATVLIDKVAERLAFERSGTRLYEALMLKCKALGDSAPANAMQQLDHLCCEELEHFHMLWECIEQLGGDPTAQTPSADLTAVASQGVPKVIADPRTTFPQCLETMMAVEVMDGDAWERLAELAEAFNQKEMAEKFRHALAQEHDHQKIVRGFLKECIKAEAGVS